jgi:hypothetical protein
MWRRIGSGLFTKSPDRTQIIAKPRARPTGTKPVVVPYREHLQRRETSMKIGKTIFVALLLVGVFSPAHALTQQELIAKLESAGYSQIREIKSTAEGTSVKAMKNGKEVSLVVDSSGQIQERR